MVNDISVGPLTIHVYGLMIGLGFLAALGLCLLRSKKFGLLNEHLWNIFYCAIIGGVVGARLLYIIVELPNIVKDVSILWDFSNGFVVYGGLFGGIFAGWLYCKKAKINFIDYFELVMPGVSLAQGIGRIGCLFAGCCYGKETDSWFAIEYHKSNHAPNGVKLIPTQIISSVGDFLICAILVIYASKKPKRGHVALAWVILYSVGRFAVEFLRNDHRGSIGVLSTSQMISIALALVSIILFIISKKKSK